jgi:hypothetical protein
MRQLRLGLGLLATTCVCAFGAAPAVAHEFIASKSGKTKGSSETEQTFRFGAFHITCQKAVAKGAVAAGGSSTYATSIKFTKCLTAAYVGGSTNHQIFLRTRWLTPLAIEYHENGFVETGEELTEQSGKAVLAGGSAELKVNTGRTESFEKSECHISWPEQTIPFKATVDPDGEYSAASYSNEAAPHNMTNAFPDGLQHYIVISNTFKKIVFELEGEPCEEWGRQGGPEGTAGTYTGSFPQFLNGGNLEFE